MAKSIAVLLDDKRIEAVKGSALEGKIDLMFGGQLSCFILEMDDNKAKEVMDAFDTARVDSRGFITDVPIAFNRVLFEEIAKTKSLGTEAVDGVLSRVEEIKEAAAKEKEFLPHPEL
jgi:hypothetical protein